jgi:hypothetical protein
MFIFLCNVLYIIVCPFVLGILLPVLRFTVFDCPFRPSIYGLWLPLSCLDLRSLIAPFVLIFTVSDCPFRPSIYGLWLPLSSFDLRSLIAPFVSSSFSLPCKEPQTIIPNELFAIGNFWYFRDIGLWELLYCFTRREHDTFCTRGVNNVQSSSCTASRRPSRLVLQATETLCLISILLYSFRIDLHYLVCN